MMAIFKLVYLNGSSFQTLVLMLLHIQCIKKNIFFWCKHKNSTSSKIKDIPGIVYDLHYLVTLFSQCQIYVRMIFYYIYSWIWVRVYIYWLIELCFTLYRQYFNQFTAVVYFAAFEFSLRFLSWKSLLETIGLYATQVSTSKVYKWGILNFHLKTVTTCIIARIKNLSRWWTVHDYF